MARIDLTGLWACAQLTTGRSSAVGIGEMVTRTRLLSRLAVTQTGDHLAVTWRVLDMDVDTGTWLARVRISRALVEALEVLERGGTVRGDRVELDWAESTIGAHVDPGDPLPTDPADPRVRDPDGDGRPGVTIRFKGIATGAVHVIQRTRTLLRSDPVTDPDRITGRVEWTLEQAVLGATNPLLRLAPTVQPSDRPEESWFAMARVRDDASDAEVLETVVRLFDGR
jgi:hypothetical protein